MFAALILALVMDAGTNECIRVQTTVTGTSMNGLLWEGQQIEILGLGCGKPGRYDYVVFREQDKTTPIIKQLWGLPGDQLEILPDGKFEINGVQAKTPFGRPYTLLGSAKTRLTALVGIIDGYLVLGHPGSIDSAKVGLIREGSLLGYVLAEKSIPNRQIDPHN